MKIYISGHRQVSSLASFRPLGGFPHLKGGGVGEMGSEVWSSHRLRYTPSRLREGLYDGLQGAGTDALCNLSAEPAPLGDGPGLYRLPGRAIWPTALLGRRFVVLGADEL